MFFCKFRKFYIIEDDEDEEMDVMEEEVFVVVDEVDLFVVFGFGGNVVEIMLFSFM